MPQTILFICTGNYYRSRFAEILFNHLAATEGLQHSSYSRGLKLWDGNKGPLSRHTIDYMARIGIDITNELRFPISVTASDFEQASLTIAMDEPEHRKLMNEYFPDKADKIEYWSFADDYILPPADVLPELEKKVRSLLELLKNN